MSNNTSGLKPQNYRLPLLHKPEEMLGKKDQIFLNYLDIWRRDWPRNTPDNAWFVPRSSFLFSSILPIMIFHPDFYGQILGDWELKVIFFFMCSLKGKKMFNYFLMCFVISNRLSAPSACQDPFETPQKVVLIEAWLNIITISNTLFQENTAGGVIACSHYLIKYALYQPFVYFFNAI